MRDKIKSPYLSYLMGADKISTDDLTDLGIEIVETSDSDSRKLKIPARKIEDYKQLIRDKLTPGFWNEYIGEHDIYFIFKLKGGELHEYTLSKENEQEIDELCATLNNEPPHTAANVYKYISNNTFYHDFMLQHYRPMIDR